MMIVNQIHHVVYYVDQQMHRQYLRIQVIVICHYHHHQNLFLYI